jgi:hypothetical protein
MEKSDNLVVDSDEELAEHLHRLFIVEGNEEVEVIHPEEGTIVYTRDTYLSAIENLKKARNMSPAERMREKRRLERKNQMKFRSWMPGARVHTVDIEDEGNFGKDIEGEQIDMEGMIFTVVRDYPKGIELLENEIGSFVDESMKRPPIRILSKAAERGVDRQDIPSND